MNSTLIIAEAGVNHNGSIDLAKKLIDVAADAKVDFVKFQTFKSEKLVSPLALKADYQKENTNNLNETQHEMLKKLELSVEDHYELIKYCELKKVKFFSTAFDLESLEFLHDLGFTLFKIPSGELTNLPYIEKVAEYAESIILSTGMSTMQEIEEAVSVLQKKSNVKLTILHCNTEYPTPFCDVNLNAMKTLRQHFNVNVGYSDHTIGIEVPIAAVALGASIIEKHFTLDKSMHGPDHAASVEPNELKAMVEAIRNIENALGSELKEPTQSEFKNISIARKSIHLNVRKKAGDIIVESDLEMLRPGDGISPMKMRNIIGKKVAKDLDFGHKLTPEDLI